MHKLTLINDTEEPITIEPGESLQVRGDRDVKKLMVSRREVLHVKQVGKRKSRKEMKECPECGEGLRVSGSTRWCKTIDCPRYIV